MGRVLTMRAPMLAPYAYWPGHSMPITDIVPLAGSDLALSVSADAVLLSTSGGAKRSGLADAVRAWFRHQTAARVWVCLLSQPRSRHAFTPFLTITSHLSLQACGLGCVSLEPNHSGSSIALVGGVPQSVLAANASWQQGSLGTLTRLDLATGKLMGTIPLGAPVAAGATAPVSAGVVALKGPIARGMMVVGLANGKVGMADPRAGYKVRGALS